MSTAFWLTIFLLLLNAFFVGSEFALQVGGRDFALDLLFFHRGLNCLVAIELKVGRFEPDACQKGALDCHGAASTGLVTTIECVRHQPPSSRSAHQPGERLRVLAQQVRGQVQPHGIGSIGSAQADGTLESLIDQVADQGRVIEAGRGP